MKKIDLITSFARDTKNEGQNGSELYNCFYAYVEQLRAKGLIKKSEVFTAASLPGTLAKLGW